MSSASIFGFAVALGSGMAKCCSTCLEPELSGVFPPQLSFRFHCKILVIAWAHVVARTRLWQFCCHGMISKLLRNGCKRNTHLPLYYTSSGFSVLSVLGQNQRLSKTRSLKNKGKNIPLCGFSQSKLLPIGVNE